ncbi:prephenate dehydrogenase [Luminiphilus syltensis]|nr:prephenate dehydrogenase/arogenate dehydrogenase family protein [Luminiphilus syltensis]
MIKGTRIALLGLGLISGSLAKALKATSWRGSIVAWGPREPSLKRGLSLGVIDEYTLDLEAALDGADIVVVGAPPAATASVLNAVFVALRKNGQTPVVTDLASIKGHIVAQAPTDYPGFVPGHPIAGSEHSGVSAARSELFAGREVILTPLATTDESATSEVANLWRMTGARVTEMAVDAHDAALAASSHSPHMIAYALTMALSKDGLAPIEHGGGALRDMTRIAASDPVMWRDVALTNRDALLAAMAAVDGELNQLRELISTGSGEELERYFAHCREVRRGYDRILNPMLEPREPAS